MITDKKQTTTLITTSGTKILNPSPILLNATATLIENGPY
jgi:hypothetical protein